MQRINLLFVITKLELGGAQKQLLSFMRLLDKERYNPFLFTSSKGILFTEALQLEEVMLYGSSYLDRELNFFKDICAFFELVFFIKKNKITIVHTHSSKAGIIGRLAARLAGVKVILHSVHGWSFYDAQAFLVRRITIALERLVSYFTDVFIVVSQHDLSKGLMHKIGRSSAYALVRYGIVPDDFRNHPTHLRRELKISDEDCVITNISCFKLQKACLDYIRVAQIVEKQVPGVKFILVGDGVMRPQIEELIRIKNLQNTVRLMGWRRDIPDILAASDVFVLTSLWEGLPIVVLEAMASSLPVVATNTGGISEVVREGKTGFLTVLGDVPALAEKIVFLVKNSQARKAMGRYAGGSLGEEYREQAMTKSIEELYCSALKQKEPK